MQDPFQHIFRPVPDTPGPADIPQTAGGSVGSSEQVRLLERRIDRLALLCQALWELLREQLNLTDEQLETIAAAVDERDGARNGIQREHPVRCSRCGRINSSGGIPACIADWNSSGICLTCKRTLP